MTTDQQATPEQLAALTVPATLPGVVRVGTPLAGLCVAVSVPFRDDGGDDGCMVARDPLESHGDIYPEALSDNAVDLTDATGRAHVAWALASKVSRVSAHALWAGTPDGSEGNRMGWWRLRWVSTAWPGTPAGVGCQVYSTAGDTFLAHLNPDDPTTLPDGSRWVDAEALRLVALHVLGGGS